MSAELEPRLTGAARQGLVILARKEGAGGSWPRRGSFEGKMTGERVDRDPYPSRRDARHRML